MGKQGGKPPLLNVLLGSLPVSPSLISVNPIYG